MDRNTKDGLAPFAQLQGCVDNWVHLLDEHGFTDHAQRALADLGSRDHLGWRFANDILAKIQGMKDRRFGNPDGWLFTAIDNARGDIRDLDNQRKCKGSTGKASKGLHYSPY